MSRKPWYKADPDFYQSLQNKIQPDYPQLRFSVRDGAVFLSGLYLLKDDGKVIDSFEVEIEFPFNYPRRLPIVYETGGRIPRIIDRHIYPSGEACLYLGFQLAEVFPEGSSLLDFLNGPVRSFFVSQSYFELTGEWLLGQWPHGPEAVSEYYGSVIGTKDQNVIARYFEMISKKEVKGHWLCPCGSGEILRDCHYAIVAKLHSDYHYAMRIAGSGKRKRNGSTSS